MDIKNTLEQTKHLFDKKSEQAKTESELEAVRVEFLGRKGKIATLMKKLADLSVDQKKEYGPLINQFKQYTQNSVDTKLQQLKHLENTTVQKQTFDVTAYTPNQLYGSLHIYTQLTQQIEDIFITMGFRIEDGPEVETDYYNFEALNIPIDHPARDMHDTFWLDIAGLLLRTHTSTIQIRTMENYPLPLSVFAPGRCYRNEAVDATHEFMFTQAEGIVIDKDISISNLLATTHAFLQQFFGKEDIALRVRPGYFPFVEPGLEIDASCPFCSSGCSICKQTKWIELLGAGLIHPNVLHCCGIDSDKYSGFAFGFGLERLAMIKHAIDDIRLFHRGKIQFLDQFATRI